MPEGTDAVAVGLFETPRNDGDPILSNSCGAGMPQLASLNVANTPFAAPTIEFNGCTMNSLFGPFDPGLTPSASALHAAMFGSAITPANRLMSEMMAAPGPPGGCRTPTLAHEMDTPVHSGR